MGYTPPMPEPPIDPQTRAAAEQLAQAVLRPPRQPPVDAPRRPA